jgi:predicted NAD/FAD-binding protein
VVSLNPVNPIDPAQILGQYDYAHPVFDEAAIAAQKEIAQLQGQNRTFFCGAWCGYGFHEDGLKAGIRAAALVKSALVNGFPTADGPPAGDLDG